MIRVRFRNVTTVHWLPKRGVVTWRAENFGVRDVSDINVFTRGPPARFSGLSQTL
jgi:hypothetical protein